MFHGFSGFNGSTIVTFAPSISLSLSLWKLVYLMLTDIDLTGAPDA